MAVQLSLNLCNTIHIFQGRRQGACGHVQIAGSPFQIHFFVCFFFHLPFCIYSFADFLVIIQINLFFLRGCKLKNVLLRFVCFGFLVFRRYPLGAHQSAQPSGVKCVATNAPEKGRLRLRLRKSNKYAACLWSSSNLC